MEAVLLEEIGEFISLRLNEGFESDQEIADLAVDAFWDDQQGPEFEPSVRRFVDVFAAEHLERQRAWPIPTDNDRLDRAFAALDRSGIVARQNFACCERCGNAEIRSELDRAALRGRVEGYVYFHLQDTERAAREGELWLSYGALVEPGLTVEACASKGRSIALRALEALRAESLSAEWSGALSKRIRVPLDWRKRRPLHLRGHGPALRSRLRAD